METIFEKCGIENKIIKMIKDDMNSEKKELARVCSRYYNAEHDINDYRIFYTNADGELVEDKSRSNIKISHAFYTELIDQKTNYLLSGFNVSSNDEFLSKEISKYFDDNFKMELAETVENASKIGFSYMYAQYGKDFRTHFKFANGIGIIEVVDDCTEELKYIINYYVTRINELSDKNVLALEVNDKEQVYFYFIKNDRLYKDLTRNINPRPHKLWKRIDRNGKYLYEGSGYDFIPFFRLDNNIDQISDLKPVKNLIDDYDLIACGLSNNLQDIAEGIYVIKGYQGENLSELQRSIKTKKIVGVAENGDMDIKTIDIPYQAREAKLALDEAGIYRFGMGLNSNQVGDGNVTNVVIKSRYSLLDLKCDKMLRKLKAFIQSITEIIINEINFKNHVNYHIDDLNFDYSRKIMANDLDSAQIEQIKASTKQIELNTILNAAGNLTEEIVSEKVCQLLNIDYSKIKLNEHKMNYQSLDELSDQLLETEKSINTQGNASNTQELNTNE